MDVNREKVETLGRMFREFYENVVNHNINQNEWDEFIDNKTKWFTTLQYPNKTFEMDEKGSRWVDPVETPEQDVEWDRYTRVLSRDLDDLIIEWITCNGETGWEKMMEFLNIRKEEFIRDVKVYVQFHRGEDCSDESDTNEDETDNEEEPFNEVIDRVRSEVQKDSDDLMRIVQELERELEETDRRIDGIVNGEQQ
jgi:hypothetical protein